MQAHSTQDKPKILAVSLDFDHALAYNLEKLQSLSTAEEKIQQIVKDSKHLLRNIALKALAGNYTNIIFFIGTNRQSFADDYHCAFISSMTKGSGSCFPVYQALTQKLQKILDKFKPPIKVKLFTDLTADIYNLKKPGSAFQEATKIQDPLVKEELYKVHFPILESEHHRTYWLTHEKMQLIGKRGLIDVQAPTLFDYTKITVLHAQMHRISHTYYNFEIDFLFLDDNLSIHDALKKYYSLNPDFIPDNVCLQLHLYTGDKTSLSLPATDALASIPGTGKIDFANYPNTLFLSAIALNILTYDKKSNSFLVNGIFAGNKPEEIDFSLLKNEIFKFLHISIGQSNKKGDYAHTQEKAALFRQIMQNRLASQHTLNKPHNTPCAIQCTMTVSPQQQEKKAPTTALKHNTFEIKLKDQPSPNPMGSLAKNLFTDNKHIEISPTYSPPSIQQKP